MELILALVAVVVILAYFIVRDRKLEQTGSHPLDGATKVSEVPYKIEPPVETTTKIDGIGHESVPVTEPEPVKKEKKAAPKKSSTASAKTAKPKVVVKSKPVKTAKPAKATSKPKKTTKK